MLNTNDGGGKSNICLVANDNVGINNIGGINNNGAYERCNVLQTYCTTLGVISMCIYISEHYVLLSTIIFAEENISEYLTKINDIYFFAKQTSR